MKNLDTCNTFDQFSEQWYIFLVSAKSVWTVLQQGAKFSAQSQHWFGNKQKKRRADALLQYVYQARNDEEHGLQAVLEHDQTIVKVFVPEVNSTLTLKFHYNPGETGTVDVTHVAGRPVKPNEKFPFVRLITVHGRDGRTIPRLITSAPPLRMVACPCPWRPWPWPI